MVGFKEESNILPPLQFLGFGSRVDFFSPSPFFPFERKIWFYIDVTQRLIFHERRTFEEVYKRILSGFLMIVCFAGDILSIFMMIVDRFSRIHHFIPMHH
jgi:hypothetical protein